MTVTRQQLTRALRDLADEAQPKDLTGAALRRGQALRRRRIITVAAAASVVVLLGATAALRPTSGPAGMIGADPSTTTFETSSTPSTSQTPTPAVDGLGVPHVITAARASAPIELVDGWYVAGATKVLDWEHRRYVTIDGEDTWVAPDGGSVLSQSPSVSNEFTLTSFRTGRTSTFDVVSHILNPQWSPDGKRLLFTVTPKGSGGLEAHVLTVATEEMTNYPIEAPESCWWCQLTWQPDGTSWALPLLDRSRPASEADAQGTQGMRIYTDKGERTAAMMPIRGYVASGAAWSPDGRHVIVTGSEQRDGRWVEQPYLVEVATGTILRAVPSARVTWLDGSRYFSREWADGERLVLRGLDGAATDSWTMPPELMSLPIHPGS